MFVACTRCKQLQHLNEPDELPKYLDKRIFSRIFEIGELAKLTSEEKMSYISSLEQKRIYNATVAHAEKKGIEKGKIEGKIEMLRELGFTAAEICQKFDFPKPEVEKYFKNA